MNIILSFYPNNRGIGYACLDMPQKLIDSGIVTVRPICNGRILKHVRKYMDFFKPAIIVLRDRDALTYRGKRIEKLLEEIAELAKEKGLTVHAYSREQVKSTFEQFGGSTKYAVSQKILEWFPELEPRAPVVRKKYNDEDYNMGIFEAIALAVTHEYIAN